MNAIDLRSDTATRPSARMRAAMAEAESIKKNVDDTGKKKLSEVYFERVFPTGAFTWFSNFGATRYGSPIGVTGAGDEFMETAFSLAELIASRALSVNLSIILCSSPSHIYLRFICSFKQSPTKGKADSVPRSSLYRMMYNIDNK